MKRCNHEPVPHAGYGATIGEHVCQYCGETIKWAGGGGGQYVVVRPEHPERPAPNDDFDFIDIFWACVIAGILAFVSAARLW